MARWIEGGCAFSAGISRSRAASTAARSSSKNVGGFIKGRKRLTQTLAARGSPLRVFLGFRIEGFRGHLAAGFFKQNFHSAFGLFQMFLAVARELHAFLKQLHGFLERQIGALEL